jgi:hypothetical protein
MLVIFEVPADAAALRDDFQEPRDSQGRMIQWLAQEGIGYLPWLINATAGEN